MSGQSRTWSIILGLQGKAQRTEISMRIYRMGEDNAVQDASGDHSWTQRCNKYWFGDELAKTKPLQDNFSALK